MAHHKSRTRHRRRHRHRQGGRAGADEGGLCASRSPAAAQDKLEETAAEGARPTAKSLVVPTDVERSGLGQGAVRQDQGDLRPLRRAVQQCRHRRAGDADRGPALRDLEEGRRHQPHRHVPVHAGSDPHDEGAGPARRPHHQQRLDLRAHAAAGRRRLYRDQACGHRPDQADRARLPRHTTSSAARSTSATPRRR